MKLYDVVFYHCVHFDVNNTALDWRYDFLYFKIDIKNYLKYGILEILYCIKTNAKSLNL